ncbi:TolC family protein [bacterium]|nr:TolC family protein [bacterium]
MNKHILIWSCAGIMAAGLVLPLQGGEAAAENAGSDKAAAAEEAAEPLGASYSSEVEIKAEDGVGDLDAISEIYTLENSVDAALRQNSQVRIADENVVQARSRYAQNKTLKNLHFNVGNITTWQNRNAMENVVVLDSLSDQLTASLEVLLTTFGSLEKQIAASYLQIGVAAWDAVTVKRSIAYEAKKRFFACLRAEALAEAAEKHREYCLASLEDTKSVYSGDKLQLSQAELLAEEAQAQSQSRIAEKKLCNSDFLNILEDRNTISFAELRFMKPEPVQIDPLFDFEDLQELALKRRSEILSIDRSLKVAEELKESEKCARNPEVKLSADYIFSPGYHSHPMSMYMLNLRINWQAWDGGMREKKLVELDSQIRTLEACRDRVVCSVCLDAQKAWINFNLASELEETARKRLDAAWIYRQAVRKKFLEKKADFLEVRESLCRLNKAHTEYIKAYYEKDIAFAGLEYSSGCEFPNRRLEVSKELLEADQPEVP